MSTSLRCGVYGLPAAETALVKTLFKLYQHGASSFRWTLVDTAPYDAMVLGAGADLTALPGHDTVKATLTLGGSSLADQPNTLVRPLRSDQMETWLLHTQSELASQTSSLPPAATVQQVNTVSVPPAGPTPASETFKLLRWPPAAMLRNDPKLIRMATVLSRRAMPVSELAEVSQQPQEQAQAFVQALRSAGLLGSPAVAPVAQALLQLRPGSSAALAPHATHATRKPGRSLVSRIRLRLGL